MKSLYVSFSFPASQGREGKLKAEGTLLCNGNLLSDSSNMVLNGNNGNLVFDLPFDIPDGRYTVQVDVVRHDGVRLAEGKLRVDRSDLKSTFDPGRKKRAPSHREIFHRGEPDEVRATEKDWAAGYMIFSRSPLRYVFPDSRPGKSELTDKLVLRVVRNEFEPLTFSLYPLRNLGKVKVTLTDLMGAAGRISREKIRVAHVESVKDATGLPAGEYMNVPARIKPGNEAEVEAGKCCRFWCTVRIDPGVSAGVYHGSVLITPQYGKKSKLPLTVIVDPITLEDIPHVDYFMLMTYEFSELTMKWSRDEKAKIYRSALKILKDYREHGMTMICPHSPFVLSAEKDGTLNLEDIFATLRAAKETGFRRPVIWYMGHLIQTAKPKHPGNILGFDNRIHLARLRYLVEAISDYAKRNGYPKPIFLPIDEPDDSYQDHNGERAGITPLLLKTIRETGGKTMLTTRSYDRFGGPDYICSGEMNSKERDAAHKNGAVYWVYNNKVTTECRNPAYARYIYGYYTWKTGIDGMSSWTFQNTQNASDRPGGPDKDVFLAYPDPEGPLATPKWEAIREGIDDHKLIYQLLKRIAKLKGKKMDTSRYETFLAGIRNRQGAPGCSAEDNQEWSGYFQKERGELISMILDADRRTGALRSPKGIIH